MADRVAIFDAELELGAIIDTDTMRGLGPVGGGPNARGELTQFIEKMPEAIWNLGSYDLAQAFMQFWSENFSSLYQIPDADNSTAMVEADDPGNDDARLAEREAISGRGEPPSLAPADTDMDADASQTSSVDDVAEMTGNGADDSVADQPEYSGPCWNCDASGQVVAGPNGELGKCGVCQGTGQLPAPVTT